MLTVGSLFSGIGGFGLGLERAGMKILWQVEINDYCNRILEKHWPGVKRYRDVREVGKHNLEPVGLICGGPPCQPHSVAGKRNGTRDARFLWPEMHRVIRELQPRYVLFENVARIDDKSEMVLDRICDDLEAINYQVWPPLEIPAAAIGAPHKRYRTYLVAHSNGQRLSKPQLWQAPCYQEGNEEPEIEPLLLSSWPQRPGSIDEIPLAVDGISRNVVGLTAIGNAVVPQIVEELGRVILMLEDKRNETK